MSTVVEYYDPATDFADAIRCYKCGRVINRMSPRLICVTVAEPVLPDRVQDTHSNAVLCGYRCLTEWAEERE